MVRWMNAQSFAVLRDGCNEVSQRNLAGVSNKAEGTGPKGLGNIALALAWVCVGLRKNFLVRGLFC
jgi:hypothetical protein